MSPKTSYRRHYARDLAKVSRYYIIAPHGWPICRDCGEGFSPYTVAVPPTGETVWADRCTKCVEEMIGRA